MDNKRFVISLLVGVVLMAAWFFGVQYLDKTHPEWGLLKPNTPPPTTLPAAVTGQGTMAPTGVMPSTMGTTTGPSALSTAGLQAVGGTEGSVVLGSGTFKDGTYAVGLKLTARGAGVEAVTLNQFKERVDSAEPFVFQTPSGNPAIADASRVFATQSITVNGQSVNLASVNWKLDSSDATSATYSVDLVNNGTPLVRVTKSFKVAPAAHMSAGYEIKVEYGFTNLGGAPVVVGSEMNGTSVPPWEIERGPERQVVHAYVSDANKQVMVRHTPAENFTATNTVVDITKDPKATGEPLGWFGGQAAYFDALVRPEPLVGAAGGAAGANYLAKVEAKDLTPDQKDAHLRDLVTMMTIAPQSLAPGQAVSLPMRVYVGPKWRKVLETAYYRAYPLNYDQTLITTSGICGFCTFQWLIGILVWMLNAFHSVVKDWGVAIILLVCVVRLLLHPVTRKSQENMVKMGKMSPELARIKEKYKDDKEGMNRAMMEFYKEQGTTPILGCLPMFLQTPIWLALYSGLQSTFELRHQPFLYGLTWIKDLSKPDHLITVQPFDLLFGMIHVSGLNVIPFLLAVVFFLQYKMTPKPPIETQTPEQIQQQKMMQWMTLLFPTFLYAAPAGLNIYILTSTTFGIIESKMIRDKLKRKEEAEKAGKVDVIDTPNKAGKRGNGKKNVEPTPAKKGLMGWIEEMQQKAEDIRNQSQNQKGKK